MAKTLNSPHGHSQKLRMAELPTGRGSLFKIHLAEKVAVDLNLAILYF